MTTKTEEKPANPEPIHVVGSMNMKIGGFTQNAPAKPQKETK